LLAIEQYLHQPELGVKLIDLIKLRVSQINGCAFCIDMHWKDLRALGESEQRLYGRDAWDESICYTDRERAALEWTEAVTEIKNDHVPDEVYERVRPYFSEEELSDLTLAIAVINAWNRLALLSSRLPAGNYRPTSHPVTQNA